MAFAFGAVEVGVEVFVGRIHTHAKGALFAEALAEVDCATHRAGLAPAELGAADRRVGRALDHQVDQAARSAGAGLHAAGALQELDTLLVLQWDGGFGVDGQAVTAVVEAVVEHETAHGEEVPVALGVVGVADRWVDASDVGDALRITVTQLGA